MRRLNRPPVVPPSLRDDGRGGLTRRIHIDQYAKTGSPPSHFQGYWNEPDVRGALLAMQGWVCAYCGADLSEAGADVDHFRPKSVHWWLAYDFANYFLSCTPCNRSVKRERFPVAAGHSPFGFAEAGSLHLEARLLLDPVDDDVERLLDLHLAGPDLALCRPHPAVDSPGQARVDGVIRFFRLNRNVPRLRKRLKVLMDTVEASKNGGDSRARVLACRYKSHSFGAIRVLERLAPHLLPSIDEEIEWLIGEISWSLIRMIERRPIEPWDRIGERDAKQMLWALAVIWCFPPRGVTIDVADLLHRFGLLDYVRDYRDLLMKP